VFRNPTLTEFSAALAMLLTPPPDDRRTLLFVCINIAAVDRLEPFRVRRIPSHRLSHLTANTPRLEAIARVALQVELLARLGLPVVTASAEAPDLAIP